MNVACTSRTEHAAPPVEMRPGTAGWLRRPAPFRALLLPYRDRGQPRMRPARWVPISQGFRAVARADFLCSPKENRRKGENLRGFEARWASLQIRAPEPCEGRWAPSLHVAATQRFPRAFAEKRIGRNSRHFVPLGHSADRFAFRLSPFGVTRRGSKRLWCGPAVAGELASGFLKICLPIPPKGEYP